MKMEDRIDDVDEIFEAFVKKKLKQLGMKRFFALLYSYQ